jgi:2-methylisocitrate lyase-like PEP mutase family enzyme
MSHAARLRALLAGEPFIAPGCYDAFSALLIEQAGFSCAYLSGASVAFTRLGRPDIGLTTLTEVADAVGNIRERVALPLIVDGDNGFGNALNVKRTVSLLEKMGASAIQLEDQTLPKRCGHLEGKTLISTGEMVGKLRAARDACRDSSTVIVARTDAVAVEGLDAGLARAHAYTEAGADVLFVEALTTTEQLARAGRELGGRIPLLANMVEGGKTPLLTITELGQLGFRLAIHPGAMVRVLGHAGSAYLRTLRADGTTRHMLDRMWHFDDLNRAVGTNDLLADGERYADDARKKV